MFGETGFYRCGCGWRGHELLCVGLDDSQIEKPEAKRFPRGQGVCPGCNREFVGCVHPTMIDVWRSDRAAATQEEQHA